MKLIIQMQRPFITLFRAILLGLKKYSILGPVRLLLGRMRPFWRAFASIFPVHWLKIFWPVSIAQSKQGVPSEIYHSGNDTRIIVHQRIMGPGTPYRSPGPETTEVVSLKDATCSLYPASGGLYGASWPPVPQCTDSPSGNPSLPNLADFPDRALPFILPSPTFQIDRISLHSHPTPLASVVDISTNKLAYLDNIHIKPIMPENTTRYDAEKRK